MEKHLDAEEDRNDGIQALEYANKKNISSRGYCDNKENKIIKDENKNEKEILEKDSEYIEYGESVREPKLDNNHRLRSDNKNVVVKLNKDMREIGVENNNLVMNNNDDLVRYRMKDNNNRDEAPDEETERNNKGMVCIRNAVDKLGYNRVKEKGIEVKIMVLMIELQSIWRMIIGIVK
ncbi:54_t:CDS:2, partial [Racocetra persica]